MRFVHLMVASALLLVSSQGTADVPEPRAILTWDLYDIVENLDQVPDDPVFLYITLFAAPEIGTVSFETVWSPWSAGGGCYEMISCGPTGGCGWNECHGAERLSNDVRTTSTLHFDSPPGNGSCIRLAFTSNGAPTDRRGTFCLRNFKITDLWGHERYLLTPNVATILGGVDLQLPQYITSVEPMVVRAGSRSALRVLGGHFSEPVQVRLVKVGSSRVMKLPTEVISDSEVSCTIAPAPADTGRWTLAARNGDGFEALLPTEFHIAPGYSPIADSQRATAKLTIAR